jgi:hypothetical protein
MAKILETQIPDAFFDWLADQPSLETEEVYAELRRTGGLRRTVYYALDTRRAASSEPWAAFKRAFPEEWAWIETASAGGSTYAQGLRQQLEERHFLTKRQIAAVRHQLSNPELEVNRAAFATQYPEEWAWIVRLHCPFAESLFVHVSTKGDLTDRQLAALRRNLVMEAQDPTDNCRAVAETQPSEWGWIEVNRLINSFAGSLYSWVQKHGRLTPGQLRAVQRSMSR